MKCMNCLTTHYAAVLAALVDGVGGLAKWPSVYVVCLLACRPADHPAAPRGVSSNSA
jgi:hypothetical protein